MHGFEYFLPNHERKLDDLELTVYVAIRIGVPIEEIPEKLNIRKEDVEYAIESLKEKGYTRGFYRRL